MVFVNFGFCLLAFLAFDVYVFSRFWLASLFWIREPEVFSFLLPLVLGAHPSPSAGFLIDSTATEGPCLESAHGTVTRAHVTQDWERWCRSLLAGWKSAFWLPHPLIHSLLMPQSLPQGSNKSSSSVLCPNVLCLMFYAGYFWSHYFSGWDFYHHCLPGVQALALQTFCILVPFLVHGGSCPLSVCFSLLCLSYFLFVHFI